MTSKAGSRECYTPGEQFVVAEDNGATVPAAHQDSGFCDLAAEKGKAIEGVQEIYPWWQPEEPIPLVALSEWK
ncbi:hypothetical protein NPIL_470051 [Nephila pilipes]|uniref:Uncharacterized protein n=1 Tax=Nephila pilipes TaxID=299642 RepID=A0A8X6NFL5_NEPPI|nr:hypothetical protein NPIL_470051 [Nephila pilipes]